MKLTCYLAFTVSVSRQIDQGMVEHLCIFIYVNYMTLQLSPALFCIILETEALKLDVQDFYSEISSN